VRALCARFVVRRRLAHVRRTLENKAFAASLCNEKSFACERACDMLRAESHGGGAFFPPQIF
jgi:hypothetical protein